MNSTQAAAGGSADPNSPASRKSALNFVILFGAVSLCADVTYEGARSITGPYLAMLGASGTVVGLVAGFGEFIGYGLRFVSGYVSDRTRRYWTITIVGYAINLVAVPLLAVAGQWEIAAALLVSERIGKAIRTPVRDAMLSHATKRIGHGWGFGLHEAMDQLGALLGPLIVAGVLFWKGQHPSGYQTAFALLAIPALLALSFLLVARFVYPQPERFDLNLPPLRGKGFARPYWIYVGASALIAAGYADFPLIAYHFKTVSVLPDNWIPVLYGIAMGVDGLAALLFGRLFDRLGLPILIVVAVLSSAFAPLVFLGGQAMAVAG
ncbi:MAG TPA: MFS transporter, partial [Nitrospiraceae bacterium]|nr:MFS transporter [Nitrospiraceae bacterium]